ncbi:AraC family transcriptional regulator [Kaistella sp.]|uniref:AraC family transcriptional regulator n=1 Tax=Kaistella sp. TaxID=2782235 RepID=UPI003C63282F
MHLKKIILYLFYVSLFFSFGKINGQEAYDKLRSKYENLSENDGSALQHINLFIQKAKQEKNRTQLVQGYRDGTFFSSDKSLKIKYADSAIISAKETSDNNLISTTYLLKGSLYYFYYKNYPAALTEYLKAYDYSKKGNDDYLKYKIVYQMGLVKSYLGYYDEALEYFKECIVYFEQKTKEKNHPNQVYNDTKGYLNSMHQAIACYQKINKYKTADSIINIGFNFTDQSKDFPLENAYFLKCKGISDYYHKNYKTAEESLTKALSVLKKNDDVYWTSVSDFYIGKSLLSMDKKDSAIKQFEKVDSIFRKRQFIFPELQENYELLISYSRRKNEYQKELSYTNDLLKVNSILKKDFPFLSSKIHRGFDNQVLVEAKTQLEKRSKWSLVVILILTAIIGMLSFWVWRYYQNEKLIKQKYSDLEKKLLEQNKNSVSISYESISAQGKSIISEDIFSELYKKLKDFEENKGFNESGLTIEQLADNFATNKSYLSQYINDTKGVNFSKYLSTLRINYITQLMYDNPKYLRLKVQGLAEECGIGSRQNFSDLFQEINGIRPTDFIKQRKKELEDGNISNVKS